MENQFIRHEPCFERILFVLTLDRKKMKERISLCGGYTGDSRFSGARGCSHLVGAKRTQTSDC